MRFMLCLFLLVGTLAAQQPPLTLQEAVAFGVERHPEVQARRLRVEAARAFAEGTGTQPNPVLTVAGVLGDAQEETNNFTQRLEISGQPRLRSEIARLELERESLGLIALERKLALRVSKAYYDAWAASRRLDVGLTRQQLAERLEFVALRRFQVGEVSRNEYLRAQLEKARADAELAAVQAEQKGSLLQLALLLGRDPSQPIALPVPLEAPEAFTSGQALAIEQLLERARSRPEVAAAERNVTLGEKETELAGKAMAPSLEFMAYRSKLFGDNIEEGLMLSLSLPLFDYGEVGAEVAKREGETRARRVDRDSVLLELDLEVQEAWQRQLEFEGRRNSLRQQTERYRELSELSQRGYDSGVLTLVETLDTQRAYREALLERIRAEAETQVSRMELHLVSGGVYPVEEKP